MVQCESVAPWGRTTLLLSTPVAIRTAAACADATVTKPANRQAAPRRMCLMFTKGSSGLTNNGPAGGDAVQAVKDAASSSK
mmetsp:Transcript_7413/g.11013  ORF Transcript_7413/g.11013 Transcript_7413/m.11013 type:complete len:81 (+) Transcript_7413:417-659(+)